MCVGRGPQRKHEFAALPPIPRSKSGKKSITEQWLMNEYDTSRYALRCAERRDLVPDSAVYVRGSCALLGSLTRPRLRGGYLRGDSAPSETRRCFGWAMVGSSRARRGPRRGHGRHVARGRRTRRPRFTSTRLARITQFERARNQGARDRSLAPHAPDRRWREQPPIPCCD